MKKAVGEVDILQLLHKYTADVEGVSSMLYDIFPLLTRKELTKKYYILLPMFVTTHL